MFRIVVILLALYACFECNDSDSKDAEMRQIKIEKFLRNSSNTDVQGLVNLNFQLTLDDLLSQLIGIIGSENGQQEDENQNENMDSKEDTKENNEEKKDEMKPKDKAPKENNEEKKDEMKPKDKAPKTPSKEQKQSFKVFIVKDVPASKLISKLMDSDQQEMKENDKRKPEYMQYQKSKRSLCSPQKSYWRKC
jgi:cobalamin biosynthesis protein CobT